MDKQKVIRYRSLGEAHLFVAIAKADGILSESEILRLPHYAAKSQHLFDVLNTNEHVRETIREDVEKLINEAAYAPWSAQQHLDEALAFLKKAKEAGDWGVQLTGAKTEEGLQQIANLDSYTIKESVFFSEMRKRLKELE
ncbi:MAG: hypothetical protein ACOC4C_02445 [Fibrobacterota bacterium]